MPAFLPGDHGPVHLPNPLVHHSGDGYKDAIYEDFGQYEFNDYSAPLAPNMTGPSYPNQMNHYSQPGTSGMYHPAAPYPPDDYYPDHPCLHPMGAPMIAPLRIDERYVPSQIDYPQVQGYATVPEASYPKEEKPVGGVSSKLDYDMEEMTDFVSETVVGIISKGQPVSRDFRKWVLQVLNATRLPSATILLSLSYLAIRVHQQAEAGIFRSNDRSFYKMITTALILGSKFLDDNTFQNKSWAEVSNIPILEINADERDWLMAFGHHLHHDPSCVDGFDAAQDQWKRFQVQAKANKRLSALQPIDTNLKRHRSMQALSTPASHHSSYQSKNPLSSYSFDSKYGDRSYGPPSYSQYEAWYGLRSMERSPLSSASHSGPQTPEYLNNGSGYGWGPFNGYSARSSQYGYPTVTPSYTPQSSAHPSEYYLPAPRRQCAWTTHGALCQCQTCRYQNPMQSRFSGAAMA